MAQQDPGWNGQRELGIIKAGAGGESDNPNTTWRPKVKDCNFQYSAPLGQPDPEAPHYADDVAITTYTAARANGVPVVGASGTPRAGSPHKRTYGDVTHTLANKYNQTAKGSDE